MIRSSINLVADEKLEPELQNDFKIACRNTLITWLTSFFLHKSEKNEDDYRKLNSDTKLVDIEFADTPENLIEKIMKLDDIFEKGNSSTIECLREFKVVYGDEITWNSIVTSNYFSIFT